MRSFAWFVTVILATLVVVVAIWQFRVALWLFLFSLAIAAAIRSPIERLKNQGLPLRVALSLIYTLVIGSLTLLLIFAGRFLLNELKELSNDFATGYLYILVMWPKGNLLQQAIAEQLPTIETISLAVGESEGAVLQTLLGTTSSFIEIISQLILILLLSIYWVADEIRFERLWLSLVPVESRPRARDTWRTIEANVGSYIRSEMAQSLLAGFLLGLGFWPLGLEYPILLALIGALAWLIPFAGVLLALVPVAIVGLLNGPGIAILAAAYTLFVFVVLEKVIEPQLFNRRRFSGLLLLLVVMASIVLFGFPGLILGPPLSVAIQIFFGHVFYQQFKVVPQKVTPELAELKQRLNDMQAAIARAEKGPSPVVVNMVERLTHLVEKVEKTQSISQAEAATGNNEP